MLSENFASLTPTESLTETLTPCNAKKPEKIKNIAHIIFLAKLAKNNEIFCDDELFIVDIIEKTSVKTVIGRINETIIVVITFANIVAES